MSKQDLTSGRELIFEQLAGSSCEYPNCTGQLIKGSYKGDHAIVCEECDTPAMRVWNHG